MDEGNRGREREQNVTIHFIYDFNAFVAIVYPVQQHHRDDEKSNENCNLHHGNSIRMVAHICYDLAISLIHSLLLSLHFLLDRSIPSLLFFVLFQRLCRISPGTTQTHNTHTHPKLCARNFQFVQNRFRAFSLACPMINKLLFPMIFV